MAAPTKETVIRAIEECRRISVAAFLERYANGIKPKRYYVDYRGAYYPLKAVWSAAHTPTILNKNFNTLDANKGLQKIGFDTIKDDEGSIRQYMEGELRTIELSYFARNSTLAAQAKKKFKYVCQGCEFNFEAFYGPLGKTYIECHHLEQLAHGSGERKANTLTDVTVLCSNCHRMVHRDRTKPLSLADLKSAIAAASDSS